jgi:hypothetical protein
VPMVVRLMKATVNNARDFLLAMRDVVSGETAPTDALKAALVHKQAATATAEAETAGKDGGAHGGN